VLKILRAGPVHTIREIEVLAQLAGDFETSYYESRADQHDQAPRSQSARLRKFWQF
jgi:hypothetical protein